MWNRRMFVWDQNKPKSVPTLDGVACPGPAIHPVELSPVYRVLHELETGKPRRTENNCSFILKIKTNAFLKQSSLLEVKKN